jgi:hypothetical protein
MPRKGSQRISREEILAALKRYAKGRGEDVRMQDFCDWLEISPLAVTKHWGPWKDLRRAAGLKRPKAAPPVVFSEQFLLGEYRRICKELGRPPTESEFDKRAVCSMITLHKRFGSMANVRRRAQVADEYAAFFGKDLEMPERPRLAWDHDWLKELWKRVRLGFALYSSTLRGKDPLPCDILFCALHDWPGCPIPVLVASDVLGERATAQGVPLPEEQRAQE